MSELKVYCCPHEGGGFQLELECGDRLVEIHIDDPCTLFVLTDTKGKDEEMECHEYAPVEEKLPMLPAVEAVNKAIKWVQESE